MKDGTAYPEAVFHGGDLADAAEGPDGNRTPSKDWLDLSTGINPTPYPLPVFSPGDWTRLPGRHALASLLAAAQDYYASPDIINLTAGPGSQALIQALPGILPDLPVTIVSPTYGGHAPAWEAAGKIITQKRDINDCDPAGITVLVNPNNPDGRVIPKDQLEVFANEATRNGGWLIVDEAFGDLDPSFSAAEFCSNRTVVVLKSFGKFYGLAGVRLGFAISPAAIAARLTQRLGAWAISGPALQIGEKALSDVNWQESQRSALKVAATRLDDTLTAHGVSVIGGTSLFRLIEHDNAKSLYSHLLKHRIYVRHFPDHPSWLRLGLPGDETGWRRLGAALAEMPA